jgi:hypothetical protein
METSDLAVNNHTLYEALVRNGFYLPKFSSGVINTDYLKGISDGSYFRVKQKNVHSIQIVSPPTKKILYSEIMKAVE